MGEVYLAEGTRLENGWGIHWDSPRHHAIFTLSILEPSSGCCQLS